MPLIQAKTEGSGNGIKTNILNLTDVATALARPASYVMKYFGFELGAQTTIDNKNERYLINGVHPMDKLQDSLDGFIEKFVLCPQCKNPETVLEITTNEMLQRDCKACGKVTKINPSLKLVSYILKNPPKVASKKQKKSSNANTASVNVIGGGKSISDIANRQQKISTSSNNNNNIDNNVNNEKINIKDEDWSVDMSEDAIKKRAEELEKLNLGESKLKYENFGIWILENKPNDVEIFKKIVELDITTDKQTIEVLAQTLLDSNDIITEITQHKGIFSKLIVNESLEKSLLGGIERIIGLKYLDNVNQIPKILMELYDNDLASEDVIREWGTHISKKYVPKNISRTVRKSARPFLKWLDEAEEDDSEDEDSE